MEWTPENNPWRLSEIFEGDDPSGICEDCNGTGECPHCTSGCKECDSSQYCPNCDGIGYIAF